RELAAVVILRFHARGAFAVGAEIRRPERATIRGSAGKRHYGEPAIMVVRAAWRCIGQDIDGSVDHARREYPIIASMELRVVGDGGIQAEGDLDAVLQQHG